MGELVKIETTDDKGGQVLYKLKNEKGNEVLLVHYHIKNILFEGLSHDKKYWEITLITSYDEKIFLTFETAIELISKWNKIEKELDKKREQNDN